MLPRSLPIVAPCAGHRPQLAGERDDVICLDCGSHRARAALLLERIRTLASTHVELELVDITAESPWPLGGDSLTSVEVLLQVEQEFGVSISADDAERIYTLGDAIRYFDSRVQTRVGT